MNQRKKLHLSESFLGQHYKRWCRSDDQLAKSPNHLNIYCAQNDLGDESREELWQWEQAGFPDNPNKNMDRYGR